MIFVCVCVCVCVCVLYTFLLYFVTTSQFISKWSLGTNYFSSIIVRWCYIFRRYNLCLLQLLTVKLWVEFDNLSFIKNVNTDHKPHYILSEHLRHSAVMSSQQKSLSVVGSTIYPFSLYIFKYLLRKKYTTKEIKKIHLIFKVKLKLYLNFYHPFIFDWCSMSLLK